MITDINKFRKINENNLSTADELRLLAKEIKSTYREYKFSIIIKYNHISVSILSGPIELRLDPNKTYEHVNNYYIKSNYENMPEARDVLQDIADIMGRANYTQSEDGDYGSIPNYYISLSVGKWDKPYILNSTK